MQPNSESVIITIVFIKNFNVFCFNSKRTHENIVVKMLPFQISFFVHLSLNFQKNGLTQITDAKPWLLCAINF